MGASTFFNNYFSFTAVNNYRKRLIYCFTVKFVWMCASVYFLLKGVVESYSGDIQLPYYERAGLSGLQTNINSSISFAPWTLKGFVALFADTLPLFGYQKKYYLYIASFVGTSGCIVLFFLPYETVLAYPTLPALLLALVNFNVMTYDLLCQGKYVEFMRIHPEAKGDIWTFVYGAGAIGSFLPAGTVGAVSQYGDVRWLFLVMFVMCLQAVFFTFAGCMVNDKISSGNSNRFNWGKIRTQYKPMTLCFLMALTTIGVLFSAMFGSTTLQFIYGISSSLILAAIAFWALPLLVAKANLFIFLIEVLYVNIAGALDFYYVAPEDCWEASPHFDYVYYRTYVSYMATFSILIGTYIFQVVLTRYTYRFVFVVTTIIRVIASLFDLIIINRINISIGIPDKVIFMIGSTIIYNATWMMNVIPISLIMSRLCPKSIEVTIFAVLAGFANQGLNMARFVGSFFIDIFGIQTQQAGNTECDYSNLTWLVLTSHVICPITCVLFSIWLVPNMLISDNMLNESETTEGFSGMYHHKSNPNESFNIVTNSPNSAKSLA